MSDWPWVPDGVAYEIDGAMLEVVWPVMMPEVDAGPCRDGHAYAATVVGPVWRGSMAGGALTEVAPAAAYYTCTRCGEKRPDAEGGYAVEGSYEPATS